MGSMIEQKVAIVTGASSGIGLELAKHLHGHNYKVALTARRADIVQAEASALDPTGVTAMFVKCDVSSYAAQQQLFQAVWREWGRIDVLMANAGCVDRDSKYNLAKTDPTLEDVPPEPDISATDINFKGVVYGIRLASHYMRHNPIQGGRIVVTGSMVGIHPCPTYPEYCASKAAVHQYVRSVSPMLAQDNIMVNAVMPGAVDTHAMPSFTRAFLPTDFVVKSALFAAYDMYLGDEASQRTGELLEVARDKHFLYEIPEFKGGYASYRNAAVYEPWFELMHGRRSNLAAALQGPPGEAAKFD